MKKILMYATLICPYCLRAELLLKKKGVKEITKILLDHDESKRVEMIERTGRKTVPQIFIGDTYVGGCDDLINLNTSGELDRMLDIA